MYLKQKLSGYIIFPFRARSKPMSYVIIILASIFISSKTVHSQSIHISDKNERLDWIQTARVFLMAAYQSPFAPELAFEWKRWYDIKRRNLGDVVFKGVNSLEPLVNFDATRNYLFPIPKTELDVNPNLAPNNPGY